MHVHAQRELACTANISIAHERILLKFKILLSDNQMNTVRSVWEKVGTCVLGLNFASTTMKVNANLSSYQAPQLLPAMWASLAYTLGVETENLCFKGLFTERISKITKYIFSRELVFI